MHRWRDVIDRVRGGNPPPPRRVDKPEAEWRAELAPDVFQVTRLAGTERPFSSPLCGLFEPGRYGCACCGTPLFDAGTKFESGTGWPSFTAPLADAAVAYHGDESHGMVRVEILCNACDAHLGHVFPDGPPPTGLRYCVNALSLRKLAAE
ncbi:peptide-methionine (R)-S-oxide reductase MsrB [Arenimonas caeni]|jgi:peptide-methionine (R)-S-oxide reductase|uniref:Peptide methionine sulfoxide reductase MsrB n=1 Tax=Arenimonas caeni TaxID=2058085 RepID=A0A2P6M842_9GAMM|nr:peptide-methionine (R)-S-oxide reductase MsrB [Arenimonas caeni]MDY0020909.1 peptide-methionine (R)-S-oxide reductase MsrB [Arenimonas caeni]PRH82169.1 peptide-methionine (R)-S-oxide reductase [Arenimonas caeni]